MICVRVLKILQRPTDRWRLLLKRVIFWPGVTVNLEDELNGLLQRYLPRISGKFIKVVQAKGVIYLINILGRSCFTLE